MLFVGVFSLMLISQMRQSTSSVFLPWSSDSDMHPIGGRPAYGDALLQQKQQQRLTTSETAMASSPNTGLSGLEAENTGGVVPSAWYKPQSTAPLLVRFLGRQVLAPPLDPAIKRGSIRVDTNSTDDPLWDAVDRSKYLRLIQSVMYDPFAEAF